MGDYCLGLQFLGTCSYDPASPGWHIISLGDAVTAIALVITFSQLLTPTLKSRISRVFPKVYILWAIAVTTILAASLLPLLPGYRWPLLGYPIFWEFVGAGLIITSICWLLLSFNRPLNFNQKSVKSITSLVVRVIATGEGKDYTELALSVRRILKDLVSNVKGYDSIEAEFARREGRDYKPPSLSVDAGRILQICSDQAFCSAVVRKEPGFAITLFEEMKSQSTYNGFLKPLVWELVRQSLLNTDSILYREEKFRGLGFVHGFTKSAFSHGAFNESVQPLSGYNLILEKHVPLETLKRYGEVLCELVEAYLHDGRFYEHSFSLYSSFGELIDYAGRLSWRVDSCTQDEVYQSSDFNSLNSISQTLSNTIELFAAHQGILDEALVAYWKGVERNRDHSPFEYVATWMFDFLKGLSHTRKYDPELRTAAISPWMDLYTTSGETVFHQEVHWRLEEKIFKQLKVNLEEGLYPAITRPIICVLGIFEEVPGAPRDDAGFRKKFFEYIQENFHALYERDPERALDKLPVGTTYKSDTRQLIQRIRKGDERILQL